MLGAVYQNSSAQGQCRVRFCLNMLTPYAHGRAAGYPRVYAFSFTGSPLLSSLPALPAVRARQIRLASRLQPLREAPQSHPTFPPQTQADSYGFTWDSRRLTGFGSPASFGPLPAALRLSAPPDWQSMHRLLITVHYPRLAPAPPDPECGRLAATSTL